ncbi:acyl carrier protein phosphodiesterase [Pseudomonas rhodesiae]|nr:acyl carrier protein phosphodiesterase [Pseudomonas rhodesiae]
MKSLLGADRQGDCEAGYLSLQLSRELARLQRHIRRLAPGSPIARCAATATRRLAQSADHTAISAAQARRAAKSMQRLGAEQWAARYRDLAWLLEQYENATTAIT